MKAILIFTLFVIFGQSQAAHHLEKWVEKIKNVHFLNSCWGQKTMMKYYKIVEKLTDECAQLTPAFEINLFENNVDSFGGNSIFDETEEEEETSPFISGNGFQTLVRLFFLLKRFFLIESRY